MTHPLVFSFGPGMPAEAQPPDRRQLGAKGARLAEMAQMGMPVPPGFTLGTEVYQAYAARGRLPELGPQLDAAIAQLEAATELGFGDPARPLCLAVRSGAVVSMPGMLDTILDVGLNPATVRGLAARYGDPAFAWDCYRRFIESYGRVVLGVGGGRPAPDPSQSVDLSRCAEDPLGELIEAACAEAGVERPRQLSAEALEALCGRLQAKLRRYVGQDVPEDVRDQLRGAIEGVLGSWHNARARAYRSLRAIDAGLGTAVSVQAMVYGNLDERSCAGVALSRDPQAGAAGLFGEYLPQAQGEDVVGGRQDPLPLRAEGADGQSLAERAPALFIELEQLTQRLEAHFGDILEVEFTVQQGVLFILQSRLAPRAPRAALKSAVKMVDGGHLRPDQALLMISPEELEVVLRRSEQHTQADEVLTTGLAASPGVASGALVLSAEEAEARGWRDEAVILVRDHTSPEDIRGVERCAGLLTTRGGLTCHAAVIARGLRKPCVVGARGLQIDLEAGCLRVGDRVVPAGSELSIDGRTGQVTLGRGVRAAQATPPEVGRLIGWADARRRLKVRSSATELADLRVARELGAEGLGMVALERGLLEGPLRAGFQRLALADSELSRQTAAAALLDPYRAQLAALLTEAGEGPIALRLFDAPLSAVLPSGPEERVALAEASGRSLSALEARIEALRAEDPRFGLRGVRLGLIRPELYRVQLRALFEALADRQQAGAPPQVELLLPMVSMPSEVDAILAPLHRIAARVGRERDLRLRYQVGVVVEVPRAALLAGELAARVDLLLFGTNDLTQCCYGLSKDAAADFLPAYREAGLLADSPFHVLDTAGLGELLKLACARARAARPDIRLGVAGAQVEDPASVAFFDDLGVDFVSCAPLRVPIAKLVAAQAVLQE